jgi:N6-L-threonylcarbamoyladenine synthase
MLILGIESSCDETAAAVVEGGRRVLSNAVASQHALHEEYGGVVPEIASRAHVERVTPVVRAAMDDAGVALSDLDAIAVGHRPGLIGALLVGVSAAKALAWSLDVPLIGADHVEAHLHAGLLDGDEAWDDVFPALGLVVSGGHTALYRCDGPGDVTWLGGTIDDAVGEAYDKVAALLGLGHPGGPAVDALAQQGDEATHDFPVSLLGRGSLDFSFSGLKTAVLYAVRGTPTRDAEGRMAFEREADSLAKGARADVCASFQRAAVSALMRKLSRAHERLEEDGISVRTLLVGGGVSANSELRERATAWGERRGLDVRLPRMAYCLDNAAMIAGLAHVRLERGESDGLGLQAQPTASRGPGGRGKGAP